MAVELADYIESLEREVTPAGSDIFDGVSPSYWIGMMADAFWEARLDGFLTAWEADEDGIVTPIADGGTEIPRDQIALIILYAGIRVLRNVILNTNTSFKAVAGPVSFEVGNSAMLLREMLQQLAGVKGRLLEQAHRPTSMCIIDGFSVRQVSPESYGGFLLVGS